MQKKILLLEKVWEANDFIYILVYLMPPAIKNLNPHIYPIRVQ